MGAPAATSGPEKEWIERARRGETEAFRALVDLHRDRAYGLALRIVRSPADAEEVAQDAFVRVWRALPRFRGDAAFGTWLYRIVVRLAIDRAARLKSQRTREASPEAARAEEPTAAPARETGEAEARIERLVAETLTEAQRAVVTLYYYRDHSVEEVARLLAIPENTAKTHLNRARAALRSAWRESGES
jgi:RNA polymerase sigma-70 factor (ECF subfamily)